MKASLPTKPMYCSREYFNTSRVIQQYEEIEYFIAGPETEADRVASSETTLKMHEEFSDVFTEIWCFKGTFLTG